jgi:hypothetical protein
MAAQGTKNYVVGFYNLENLFDVYNDPVKNDEEFLPEGKNKWTEAKYQKKLQNMAKVIKSMKEENGVRHALLGVSEIENRLVLEDLVMEPQIAAVTIRSSIMTVRTVVEWMWPFFTSRRCSSILKASQSRSHLKEARLTSS